MPGELQLKPFERKDGQNYKVIQITDVALHTGNHRATNAVKALEKGWESGEPGRIYSPLEKPEGGQKELIVQLLRMDPEFVKYVQEQEALGFKIILSIPKDGIPMLAGKDTRDFVNSPQGQRILRWIDKSKQEE